MKTIIYGLLILAIALGVYQVWFDKLADTDTDSGQENIQTDATTAKFFDSESGLRFEYPSGDDGYVGIKPEQAGTGDDAPTKTLVIYKTSDYEELQRDKDIPREGPPGMVVEIFNPGPNITPEEWAQRNPSYSNYQITASSTWAQIDGNSAFRYKWEGLYSGETVVISRKGWVYVLSVAYLPQDDMLQDFNTLLDTVKIGS